MKPGKGVHWTKAEVEQGVKMELVKSGNESLAHFEPRKKTADLERVHATGCHGGSVALLVLWGWK